jgi:dihydrofolate reductase
MIVSIVVAMANNRVIGTKNALPWYIPEDLKKFRLITTGHAIIMGRKTFESLPHVLPNRLHYVITRSVDFKRTNPVAAESDSVFIVSTPEQALEMIHNRIDTIGDVPEEVFVIGGGEIYNQTISLTSRLYITYVKRQVDGDTFFPEIDCSEWIETSREVHDEFDFVVYDRKNTGKVSN